LDRSGLGRQAKKKSLVISWFNPQEQSYPGNFYAPIGDFLREEYCNTALRRVRARSRFLTELLQLPQGARILDVGCGPGRHSLDLARRGFVQSASTFPPVLSK
jgi:2-polyprenyl-3-methyl-5-hydroxy-6-metoxy-1,4-benzoquinol methylase